ncbi:MAG: nitric oxide synthase oxygenase, partial [Dolichospermum sp.]
AIPLITNMMLDIGGVKYTSAPFNGWYMGTEIGSRNFGDECRYNLLLPISKRLGLNTRNNYLVLDCTTAIRLCNSSFSSHL